MSIEPDPNGNPFSRARMDLDPTTAGLNAATLAHALADGNPSIRLRAHHAEEGYLMIDAIEMTDGEIELSCARIAELINATHAEKQELNQRYKGTTMPSQWSWLGTPSDEMTHITGV